MPQLFLTDEEVRENLFPFSLIRSVADLRIGILTIREKWERYLGRSVSILADADTPPDDAMIFSSNILPSAEFIGKLNVDAGALAATPDYDLVKIVQFPWHICSWNDWAIRQDFKLITAGRQSAPVPTSVTIIGDGELFIEEGARLSHCMINLSTGPVYIGANTVIMEGTQIRGSFALCEGSVVKMGSRIYGATTIGPYCVAGGEIKNSVMLGYSNKAHDGYMGDSVIGEWCNWGAGTSNSNLKNNAGEVKVWNPFIKDYLPAGKKCGLLMGDYSQCAINTSFNTGTVTGICSNVFGTVGLTPKYIPSFTWGTQPLTRYEFDKAIVNIRNWKMLKDNDISEAEIQTLRHIFDQL